MNVILAILAVVLSVLDVTSTLKFMAAHNGTIEGNPLSAWMQSMLPRYWVDARIACGMAAAIVGFCMPAPFSTIGLSFACAWWGFVVFNNYRLASKP